MLCICARVVGDMAIRSVAGGRNEVQRMMRIKRPYSIEDVVQVESL